MCAPHHGRIRPIVCKFSDTVPNYVLRVSGDLLTFNVFDQLPQEVQQRRKALIPEMMKARSEGKRAYLVRDKLCVNNREYTPGSG